MSVSIVSQVCEVVRTNMGRVGDFSDLDETSFLAIPFSKLELDSMAKMEMVMVVEEKFSILLNEGDVQNCETVGEFASLVEKSVAQ